MATISGTATLLSDSSAAVGAKITLINSDTDEVAVSTSDVKCVTTTGASGAFEFLDVPDGINVHVVGEWDDAGTLYNAKSQPFISTGTAGDPGTLMTSYGVEATSVWIKADADPTTFTTRDAAGTLHITAWGSKSPAGISGTAPATESQQPVYDAVNGLVKFVAANSTNLTIPNYAVNVNGANKKYTISVAIPVWDNVLQNQGILSSRDVTGERFQFYRSTGNPYLKAYGAHLGSYSTLPTWLVMTCKVNHEALTYRRIFNNEAADADSFVALQVSEFATDPFVIGRRFSLQPTTMDLAELVIIPAELSDTDMDDLHNRMLTLYEPA